MLGADRLSGGRQIDNRRPTRHLPEGLEERQA
jgi:hypothetical protein